MRCGPNIFRKIRRSAPVSGPRSCATTCWSKSRLSRSLKNSAILPLAPRLARTPPLTSDNAMKIVDLTHVMNVHTPGWVGYAGNKMYYAQNLQTQMIVAQRIDTALHVGTHFDGAMHATDNRKGDMAHLPLDYLVNRGVIVDISKHMH